MEEEWLKELDKTMPENGEEAEVITKHFETN